MSRIADNITTKSFNKITSASSEYSHGKEEETLDFERIIALKKLDTNLYMSEELWRPFAARGVYGGQIIAQALNAAYFTVGEEFNIHSLHCYFILACVSEVPVIYKVKIVRDGRSFATRSVVAKQFGKHIFTVNLSFAKEEKGTKLEHQVTMHDVPAPENLISENVRVRELLNTEEMSIKLREFYESKLKDRSPMDYRYTSSFSSKEVAKGYGTPRDIQDLWFKLHNKTPENSFKIHACAIAYASDNSLLKTSLQNNGIISKSVGMLASIDHTIWFHSPARADEWLLHSMRSPRANDGRGLTFGQVFSRDGRLVASTAQEGLIRLSDSGKALQEKYMLAEHRRIIQSKAKI
ncbi:thioesterase-like superfamily-domain-containing protein [Spinellus fusiger]|nr:thioesterase-like superfamily-domain-containing protein [Spinellus fusiger]